MVENFQLLNLKHFHLEQIKIQSSYLKGNVLEDSHERLNPVMMPKKWSSKKLPVVLVLPGFTGNGPKYLGPRSFEENFAEQIDRLNGERKAPTAVYVFVDAWSFWGGSQFLDSAGTGMYESYLVKELFDQLNQCYPVDPQKVCLMGASSGAYGAIHLASKYPKEFPYFAAFAPDSFFEVSYLPDIYSAAPFLRGKTYSHLKDLHRAGKILSRRDGHKILNAIGMCSVYSPKGKSDLEWPIDFQSGILKESVWKLWKKFDPLVFLKIRKAKLKQIRACYLEVGDKDQFHLQFGARQIQQIFKDLKIPMKYQEFEGNHFDFPVSRGNILAWLAKEWKI